MNNKQLKALADSVIESISKIIVGKDVIRAFHMSNLWGHVLLEDVPGTGKTLLAKTLSRSLDLQFSRVRLPRFATS